MIGPKVTFEVLKVLFLAKLPGFIWGDPGIGKSDIMRQLAAYFGVNLIDLRAVLLDPVDLRGLPVIQGNKAVWCPPTFLPDKPGSIIFFDELPTAPPLVQGACLQLILDGKVGEYVAPQPTWFFGAGNPENVGAIVHRMPSPLANRFVHINMNVNPTDWREWADSPKLPECEMTWKDLNLDGISDEIKSFIELRPELLHRFDADEYKKPNAKAFATPRSVEFADRIYQTCVHYRVNKKTMFHTLKGCCGKGWASELVGYLGDYEKLPLPGNILANPDTAEVPKDMSLLVALSRGLSSALTEDNAEAFMTYARRLPQEFSVKLIKTAERTKRQILTNTQGYVEWAVENKGLIKGKDSRKSRIDEITEGVDDGRGPDR